MSTCRKPLSSLENVLPQSTSIGLDISKPTVSYISPQQSVSKYHYLRSIIDRNIPDPAVASQANRILQELQLEVTALRQTIDELRRSSNQMARNSPNDENGYICGKIPFANSVIEKQETNIDQRAITVCREGDASRYSTTPLEEQPLDNTLSISPSEPMLENVEVEVEQPIPTVRRSNRRASMSAFTILDTMQTDSIIRDKKPRQPRSKKVTEIATNPIQNDVIVEVEATVNLTETVILATSDGLQSSELACDIPVPSSGSTVAEITVALPSQVSNLLDGYNDSNGLTEDKEDNHPIIVDYAVAGLISTAEIVIVSTSIIDIFEENEICSTIGDATCTSSLCENILPVLCSSSSIIPFLSADPDDTNISEYVGDQKSSYESEKGVENISDLNSMAIVVEVEVVEDLLDMREDTDTDSEQTMFTAVDVIFELESTMDNTLVNNIQPFQFSSKEISETVGMVLVDSFPSSFSSSRDSNEDLLFTDNTVSGPILNDIIASDPLFTDTIVSDIPPDILPDMLIDMLTDCATDCITDSTINESKKGRKKVDKVSSSSGRRSSMRFKAKLDRFDEEDLGSEILLELEAPKRSRRKKEKVDTISELPGIEESQVYSEGNICGDENTNLAVILEEQQILQVEVQVELVVEVEVGLSDIQTTEIVVTDETYDASAVVVGGGAPVEIVGTLEVSSSLDTAHYDVDENGVVNEICDSSDVVPIETNTTSMEGGCEVDSVALQGSTRFVEESSGELSEETLSPEECSSSIDRTESPSEECSLECLEETVEESSKDTSEETVKLPDEWCLTRSNQQEEVNDDEQYQELLQFCCGEDLGPSIPESPKIDCQVLSPVTDNVTDDVADDVIDDVIDDVKQDIDPTDSGTLGVQVEPLSAPLQVKENKDDLLLSLATFYADGDEDSFYYADGVTDASDRVMLRAESRLSLDSCSSAETVFCPKVALALRSISAISPPLPTPPSVTLSAPPITSSIPTPPPITSSIPPITLSSPAFYSCISLIISSIPPPDILTSIESQIGDDLLIDTCDVISNDDTQDDALVSAPKSDVSRNVHWSSDMGEVNDNNNTEAVIESIMGIMDQETSVPVIQETPITCDVIEKSETSCYLHEEASKLLGDSIAYDALRSCYLFVSHNLNSQNTDTSSSLSSGIGFITILLSLLVSIDFNNRSLQDSSCLPSSILSLSSALHPVAAALIALIPHLRPTDDEVEQSTHVCTDNRKKKSVHFCDVDGSSVTTPTYGRSIDPLLNTTRRLHSLIGTIDTLINSITLASVSYSQDAGRSLLTPLMSCCQMLSESASADAASKAVSVSLFLEVSPGNVQAIAKILASEMSAARNMTENEVTTTLLVTAHTELRHRTAWMATSVVRSHLRWLLDAPPTMLTAKTGQIYSPSPLPVCNIYKLFTLKEGKKAAPSSKKAVKIDVPPTMAMSFSSLFTQALRQIYEAFVSSCGSLALSPEESIDVCATRLLISFVTAGASAATGLATGVTPIGTSAGASIGSLGGGGPVPLGYLEGHETAQPQLALGAVRAMAFINHILRCSAFLLLVAEETSLWDTIRESVMIICEQGMSEDRHLCLLSGGWSGLLSFSGVKLMCDVAEQRCMARVTSLEEACRASEIAVDDDQMLLNSTLIYSFPTLS